MNIAMFGHKRIPSREGGIEVVVEELCTRMVQKGHNVTCYNRRGHHVSGPEFDCESSDQYRGIKVKSVFTIERKGFAAVTSSFFASLKAALGDYDIVHIHAEGPAFFSFIPKMFGKSVIVTIHGLDWQRAKWKGQLVKQYIKWGEKNAVKYADRIIVLSQNLQKYFKDIYKIETCYIPNGVIRPEIKTAEEIKKKFGLTENSYILYLARIVKEKGVHYLIEAYRDVKTDKKLVIAGGPSDSEEYMQELQRQVQGDCRIIFTGFVQGELLKELYSNAFIYVLPSDIEGMPLSLLEAMSYGNCCVVSDIAECVEVVEDKAVIFQKGNTEDLRHRIQELCDFPHGVATYKAQASDFICEKYNWDKTVDQTLALYNGKKILNY